MKLTNSVLSGVAVLILAIGVAIPVGAQGQTPTSPVTRPTDNSTTTTPPSARSSSRSRLGNTTTDPNQQGTGRESILDRLRNKNKDSKDTKDSKDSKDTQGKDGKAAEKTAGPQNAIEKPGSDKSEKGSKSSSSGSGNTVKGGGGKTGGSNMKKGGEAQISVKGEGKFEPVYKHELEFKDLPDVGDPLTLAGPMPLPEFLEAIHMATSWDILATAEAQKVELQFWIQEKKPKDAMEVLKFNDLYYEYTPENNYLTVMTKSEFLQKKYGETELKEFQVANADVAYIESAFDALISGAGRIITDPRTNRIYVWDAPDNLEQMSKTFDELDVPLEKAEFSVTEAEVADIESVLSSLASANGSILSDVRTGQIVVWDSPAILDQMKLAVAKLDVPVETKTFDLEHVNAEDILDNVEALLSERGLIQVDPRYNALLITDLPSRVEKMAKAIEAFDRDLETRSWKINYADIEFVADEIEELVPEDMGSITMDDLSHQITVTALPARLDKIEELIAAWDIKRKQVLIEAYIVEMGSQVQREFNINWSYFGNNGSVPLVVHGGTGFDSAATPSAGQSMNLGQLPYAVPAYGALALDDEGNITRPVLTNIEGKTVVDHYAGNDLAVTLNYLDSQNKATILSSPRVVVQDGEEATFENATRVPYISSSGYGSSYPYSSGYNNGTNTNSNYNNYSSYGYGNYGYNSGNRVEFIDVGTILSVLPVINEDDSVLLDISAEDSTYTDKDVKANDQVSTVPEKTERAAETQVRVHSGDTVVLGGLRRDRSDKSMTKTPLLGDIPLLGNLFRNPSRKTQNSDLMIFITATIVDEYSHPEAEAITKAEDSIAEDSRYNAKNLADRMASRFARGENELRVSIGQNGQMHSEGKMVTLDELKEAFFKIKAPWTVTVLIRKHPSAPEQAVTQVVEAAMEAELKVDYDNDLAPIIPAYDAPKESAAEPEAEAPAPAPEATAAPEAAPQPAPETAPAPEAAPQPAPETAPAPEAAPQPAPLEIPAQDAEPAEAADVPKQ